MPSNSENEPDEQQETVLIVQEALSKNGYNIEMARLVNDVLYLEAHVPFEFSNEDLHTLLSAYSNSVEENPGVKIDRLVAFLYDPGVPIEQHTHVARLIVKTAWVEMFHSGELNDQDLLTCAQKASKIVDQDGNLIDTGEHALNQMW